MNVSHQPRHGNSHLATQSKTPTLYGRYEDGQLTVWCPHCREPHAHGWRVGDAGPQHRAAHCCDPDSPFEVGGYYIAPKGGAL